jgi:hypothetical protein
MTDLYSILYIVRERLAIPEDGGCGGGIHPTASDHLFPRAANSFEDFCHHCTEDTVSKIRNK